ncbi:hypothetical protein [Azospirillum sp. B506]|uniref:hypothetical protein n=1 Tax=Azospirillum sp. B506 TaxID=137721 RepID=UPI00190033A7|nr:hypothetical protein [Azospirillum sp. B506]
MLVYPEKIPLTMDILCREAAQFTKTKSVIAEPSLFGVTDGKAIGTYLEHKLTNYLLANYKFNQGNSASEIDFPELEVDMKVTSFK